MERVIDRLLFITILFAILFIMHFYSLGRLSSLFGINKKLGYYLVVIGLSLSLIISTIICRYSYNPLTKALYVVAAIWFGIQFILFATVLVYEVPRLFLNIKGTLGGTIIVSIVGILTVVSIINAQFIRIKEVEIPSFGKEMKAVLLSDIHIGTIWGKNHLQKIVDRTNALEPDVVFITGDLVSGGTVLIEDAFSPLGDLEAKTFFAHGNHERYEGIEEVEALLANNGIEVLADERADFEGIEIIGLSYSEDGDRIESVLGEIDISEDKPTVLLTHVPIDPKNDRIELILAGHTHAGQIFPFNFVVQWRYKFIEGLYTLGDTRLYVTPGTGTWGPPMRLGSRNEITLFKLRQ